MWQPDKKVVSKKEVVGRRAFGTSPLVTESGGKLPPGFFKLTTFYEDRSGANLSYDRLGLKTESVEVAEFLKPLCQEHGRLKGKPFECWASVKVEMLPHDEFVPTPDEEANNPYHCDFVLDSYRDNKARMESMAFKLSMLSKPYYPP